MKTVAKSAPLAQLDRASGYEPEGREFESLRARHFPLENKEFAQTTKELLLHFGAECP